MPSEASVSTTSRGHGTVGIYGPLSPPQVGSCSVEATPQSSISIKTPRSLTLLRLVPFMCPIKTQIFVDRPWPQDFGQIHKCAHSFSLPQYPSFPHHTWRHCEQWSSPWERMMVLQQFFKNIGVTAIFLKMKFKCFKITLPFCLLWTFPLRNPLRRESAVSRSSVGLLV